MGTEIVDNEKAIDGGSVTVDANTDPAVPEEKTVTEVVNAVPTKTEPDTAASAEAVVNDDALPNESAPEAAASDNAAPATTAPTSVTTGTGAAAPEAAVAVAVDPSVASTEVEGLSKREGRGPKSDASTNSGPDDNPATFPQKLLEILSNEKTTEIISWLPHGKGFMIRNKKRFADEILPKHFKKSKFTSFTRKLNRWNFVRVTRGQETGAYYHPLFQKANPKLSTQMTCISAKASQQLQPMDPVALGLGEGGSLYPDLSDPQDVQKVQEQRQAFFQQWSQYQACMAMMQQQQTQQSKEDTNDDTNANAETTVPASSDNGGDEKDKSETQKPTEGAEVLTAEQQALNLQYYNMFLAQQQHLASLGGDGTAATTPMPFIPFVPPSTNETKLVPFPLPKISHAKGSSKRKSSSGASTGSSEHAASKAKKQGTDADASISDSKAAPEEKKDTAVPSSSVPIKTEEVEAAVQNGEPMATDEIVENSVKTV